MADEPNNNSLNEVSAPVAAAQPEVKTVQVTGSIPDADGSVSGSIRISAVVDLVYEAGVLTEVGFGAAQYTAFEGNNKALAIRSAFPKRRPGLVSK